MMYCVRGAGWKKLLIPLLALALTMAACSNGASGTNRPANEAADPDNLADEAGNNPMNATQQPADNPRESDPLNIYDGQESGATYWEGLWQLEDASESRGSIITIQAPQGERLVFSLDAFYLSNPDDENPAPNIGNISNGEAVIQDNKATFTDESLGFTLTMTLTDGELTVQSTPDTGYFGAGVSVDGTYVRTSATR